MNAVAVNDALRRRLDEDVARDVWDEEPRLALIIETAAGDIAFADVPVTSRTWGMAEPFQIIRLAALFTSEVGWGSLLNPGDSLVGAVLFSEGWGVSSDKPEAAAALMEWTKAGKRLVDHPLAVEVKMVSAVLVDGSSVMLTYGRRGVELPDTKQANVEGRIPDALREALTAFQEVAA